MEHFPCRDEERREPRGARILGALSLLTLASCVGTELVDETLPARIDLTPPSAAIQVGDTLSFQASYRDSLGTVQPGTPFEWASSDAAIASVDAAGTATGHREGQVVIRAAANGVTSNAALLTVVTDPEQIASVVVTPEIGQISVGQTLQLSAVARSLSGEELPDSSFTWSSSAGEVASVDVSGLVSALSPGTAAIVATAAGISSRPAQIEVLGRTRSGVFSGNPVNHYQVAGSVTLAQQPAGGLLLSLGSDFVSSAGPGLDVFLSHGSFVNSDSRSLGRLQSFSGAQTYAVPSDIGIDSFDWVVIHCVPFNATFGYARLQ